MTLLMRTQPFPIGAIFGGIMLTSAMVIKAPHPSYKVPGLDAGPVADGASKPAPVAQVHRCFELDMFVVFMVFGLSLIHI